MPFPFQLKIVVSLLPLILAFLFVFYISSKDAKDEAILKKVIKNTSHSMIDAKVAEGAEQKKDYKIQIKNFLDKQNAKLNLVGITYKYETVIIIAFAVFIVSALAARLLLNAGGLFMIYLGFIFAGIILMSVNKKAEAKREELTVEFLEKVNEFSSHISVGKNISTALDEVLINGQISPVLAREFSEVKQNVNLGHSLSYSFMKMYNHLKIEEIKTFAMTLSVYEETGGNLIQVLEANDNFFQNKLKIKNTQKVYISSLKTSQKMTIAIPVAFIAIIVFVNPSFFGDFYSSISGELIGILCVSVLIFGVWFSNRIAKFK